MVTIADKGLREKGRKRETEKVCPRDNPPRTPSPPSIIPFRYFDFHLTNCHFCHLTIIIIVMINLSKKYGNFAY